MNNEIEKLLTKIQNDNECEIIYAVEAGSRVWGYSSEESDYDVRFIFRQPLHMYCNLKEPKQVIEVKTARIELHGWDLLKALRLFQKSNPSFYEWLYSPIIYCEKSACVDDLRGIAQSSYSLKRLGYHYLSLTKSNIKKDNKTPKTYIQMIRAMLMVNWIIYKQELPPLNIEKLLTNTEMNPLIISHMKPLITLQKRRSNDVIHSNIDNVIIEELPNLMGKLESIDDVFISTSILNKLFWNELNI